MSSVTRFCILLLLAAPASAYDVVAVSNGGRIGGSVKYTGSARPGRVQVSKDNATCGADVADESLVLGAGGGLGNVVVYLADIGAGAAPAGREVVIDQKGCVYRPHVSVATRGSSVTMVNSDPILHNAHAYLKKSRTVFNLAMPMKDQRLTKKLRKPGVYNLACDAGHTWMGAWIQVFDHPYHAVTSPSGRFEIKNVPPGTYELVFWHEKLPEVRRRVTVAAGAAATVDVALK